MRLHGCLEEEEACGTCCIGCDFFAACVEDFGHLVDEGNDVAQELHETAYAHVFHCVNAENGEHAAADESFANAFTHLVFGETFAFEELFHERFVVLSSSLYECFVHLHCLIHLVCGNILDGWCAAVWSPGVFLHEEYVDEGVEVGASLQRILDGNDLGAVDTGELFEQLVKVAVLVVELVDEEDDGLAEFFGVAEVVLCAYLNAGSAFEKDDSRVGHVESGDGCACKVIAARAIDEVDFLAIPLHMANSGED